ncbi:MAG TPA: c-type cytochrome [Vicinamibacterales bacterium]|nr:c-type cytochrome [Vicinamibacterales bacterium]
MSPWFGTALCVGSILVVQAAPQASQQAALRPAAAAKTGAALYKDACAACHGTDGKGQERSLVGFDLALPDFTDCSFATREPDADWLAVAHDGGPARGFSTTMPAFGEALTTDDLLAILGHVRTFCSDAAWPRGELNLPRTFFTEKAYPEDEAVLTTSFATTGSAAISNEIVYEKRFGARNQLELKLPIDAARNAEGAWAGGAGDIALGFKRAIAHSFTRGSIFAAGGEFIFPTGDEAAGLSKNTTVFEPFASFGQVLPRDSFIHAQAGVELPFDTEKAEREAFWRVATGKTFTQGMFGRSWTPMVELLAVRELVTGEPVLWDVVPQMQVPLNTRQHLLLNVGVRMPLNARSGRQTHVLVYVLWDWFDGGLFSGW